VLAAAAVAAALVIPGRCAAEAGDPAGRAVAAGSLFGAADDGRLAILDPATLELEVWSGAGRRLASLRVDAPSATARASGVALLGPRAMVAFASDEQPAHACVLLALDGTAPPAAFVGGEVPSRLFAAPDGWLFERLAPGDEPTIERFAADGRYLGRLAPPAAAVARAREAFGDPSYAFLRLVAAGGALWALPSFSYELWRAEPSGNWSAVPVPACLQVAARYVEGEPARRRMLERAEAMPAGEAQRLRDRVAWTREVGLNVKSYATAVRAAVGCGDELVVLTEPDPDREGGGCRLDRWDLRRRRVLASRPLAGDCPALVAAGPDGLWLHADGRLVRVDLPQPDGDPCPRVVP